MVIFSPRSPFTAPSIAASSCAMSHLFLAVSNVRSVLVPAGSTTTPVSYTHLAEYMQTLEKFCHENDAYLIVDEVKTGMGRSGKWFCFEHAGITPDVVVVGKALEMCIRDSNYPPMSGLHSQEYR